MLTLVIFLLLVNNQQLLVSSQNSATAKENAVTKGLAEFSVEILEKVTNEVGGDYNIILSTYSIWTLLSILSAGSNGATANELIKVLRLPSDSNIYRTGLAELQRELKYSASGVELDLANAIFINNTKILVPQFKNYAAQQFNVSIMPVDFQNDRTPDEIDKYVSKATRGKIPHFINKDDLHNAHMLITTAIYFKGEWNLPFNQTATFRTDFYDESVTRSIGQVMMMYQVGPYPFIKLSQHKGHVIELPYGLDEKYSMIIILPTKNVSIQTMLSQLLSNSLKSVFDDLERARTQFYGDDIQVYLPQFSITSDYTLNKILEKMGIKSLFDPAASDLRKLAYDNVYLSRCVHRATIDVNEAGTVASAISGGTIAYKSPPATFNASHPFIYFIMEVPTKTILFAGKYSNPQSVVV